MLLTLDPARVLVAADWLAAKENYQWLDFGSGVQTLSAASLKIMLQRGIHCIRGYTPEGTGEPIGLVALSNIHPDSKTATLWYLLGNKDYASHGYTSRAVRAMLGVAFGELRLNSVNAWAVEHNAASVRVLVKNGFQLIGRQRRCHCIDGKLYDRLMYDLLASEFDPTPGSNRSEITAALV
jgi:RimJ/RimL family protein N-acetyltransferase